MNHRSYAKLVIFGTLLICTILGAFTVYIDPLFHYHKPISTLAYNFKDERYTNDGISRHFDYDAIIIGTSLTESIKPSIVDSLFDIHSIKVPYAGAGYKEIHESICRALEYNSSVKTVFRCLDSNLLLRDADYVRYENIPTYLYDKNMFNDINYLLNKEILLDYTLHTLQFTHDGNETTNFDDYANWDSQAEYGTEVLAQNAYITKAVASNDIIFTQKDYEKISKNIEQNILPAVHNNPSVTFYMYFSPYHISYWDNEVNNGTFNYYIEAEKLAVSRLLQYDNVKVFSFLTNEEFLCNDNYYKDPLHYSSEANTLLFRYMSENMYQITGKNFEEYYSNVLKIYSKK